MLTLKQLRNDNNIFNQALHLYLKKVPCGEIVIKMNIRNESEPSKLVHPTSLGKIFNKRGYHQGTPHKKTLHRMRAGRNNLGVKGAVGVVDGPTTNPAPSVDTRKEKLSEAELKAIAQDIFLVLGKAFTPVELFNIFGKMVQRGQ